MNNPLKTTLEDLLENLPSVPERNCSCHIAPPCHDCVEYGGLRRAIEEANEALVKSDSVPERPPGKVSESIFDGSSIVPMADVSHIELRGTTGGIVVVMKSTTWCCESDDYNNAVHFVKGEADSFIAAWCEYRRELEASTLADLSPVSVPLNGLVSPERPAPIVAGVIPEPTYAMIRDVIWEQLPNWKGLPRTGGDSNPITTPFNLASAVSKSVAR